MASARIVIIGAGFAGASTAYHLTRAGVRDLVILEQEEFPGVHASGRNAGMVRQIVSDETTAALVREGAEFIRHPPPGWAVPVEFRENGSLLLGTGAVLKRLEADAENARKAGVPAHRLPPEEAGRKVSVLRAGDFEGAIWCPTDGVVDIHALLTGYLERARAGGAEILTSTKVAGIVAERNRVTAVVTESGTIRTEAVVNAAGSWAGEVARMAGAPPLPLRACRRHLFATDLLPWVKPDWPFVWDLDSEVYFRPESGGLLLSPCDEEEYPPGMPPVHPDAGILLHEKLARYPDLQRLPIKTVWAGLRTLAADGRFVIGWDPAIRGFFWVAGLGGHGVTASAAIGRLAADLIIRSARLRLDQSARLRLDQQNRKEMHDVAPGRFNRQ